MANRKLSDHTAITGANVNAAADYIEILDVSDTTDAASGTNKKILPSQLLIAIGAEPAKGSDDNYVTDAEKTKLGNISVTQAVDLDTIESNSNASKAKTDFITVTQNVDLDAIESNSNASKTKTDFITVTQNVDLDTMESDISSAKTKTDNITITQAVNLDTVESLASSAVQPTSTETLTNKRLTARVQAVTSSATVTPSADNDDLVTITAQAEALTIANPSGTPTQGQALLIRIKDNGTARAITFGSEYRGIGVTLPSTTVISKTMYIGLVRNTTDTKWDVIGLSKEA